MKDKTNIIVFFLLAFVFIVSILSIKEDTLTFDEPAHIGAGYSYLIKKEYRLNPEHPPLIKDIAAFPLLFLKLNFPEDHYAWQQKEPAFWWFQFDFGKELIYKANKPEKIIFFSKLAMILLLVFTGFYLFLETKNFFGKKIALLTLFFFSFSPTFLAHGRLVTTDVGASLGVLLATFNFLRFLNFPSKRNLFFAGIALGVALLIKFSLILLLPFLFFITLLFWFLKKPQNLSLFKIIFYFILISVISLFLIIIPFYQLHVLNYEKERQIRDISFNLENLGFPYFVKKFNIKLVEIDFLRGLAHYLLGLLMAIHRAASGNTMFFLGEISAEGWPHYFPLVFLLKEPLTFHFCFLISIIFLIFQLKNILKEKGFKELKKSLSLHFNLLALFIFVILYWLVSLKSKLNLGVRHLLPVFPFSYIIASVCLEKIIREKYLNLKIIFFSFLFLWQIVSVIKSFPYFLSYFNELIGGPKNGFLYTTDSNLDWGQDLKRLALWVEKQKIEKIYLDYFGGGDPSYYLKEKYLPWNGKNDPSLLKKPAFLAVSVNSLQSGRALPGKNFNEDTLFYYWLFKYEPPVYKVGYSIFVYFLEK